MQFKLQVRTPVYLILFAPIYLFAQKEAPVQFGTITQEDFKLPQSSIIDSSTQAVVISDVGNTEFKGNNKGGLSYIYSRKTRIKLLHQSVLDDLATVFIQLRSVVDGKINDELSEVECYTYNIENGKVSSTRLPLNEIFENRLNSRTVEKKFTMPAVKMGSIIEYSYKITSYYYHRMPEWKFQHQKYPVLWSEYNIDLPAILMYSSVRTGTRPFFIETAKEGWVKYLIKFVSRDAYISANSYSVGTTTIKRKWVMKDIPAFHDENYLSAPTNYMDKLSFQLVQGYYENGAKMENYTWSKFAGDLLEDQKFGYAVLPSQNAWLQKIVQKIVGDEKNPLIKANLIYDYVIKNFNCTDHEDYYTSGLYELMNKKSGSVGDINLLLTAMLKMVEIPADPVVLSTRDQGFVDPVYPIIDNINYVICRSRIGGTIYNLDASHPYLGFGNLPSYCYNGYARVISQTDTTGVYLVTDSIKEKKIIIVNLTNDEKNRGSLVGNCQIIPGKLESNNLRTGIIKEGEKEYFKKIETSYRDVFDIEKIYIDSLRNGNEQLRINVDFKFKNEQVPELIYFTPAILSESFKEKNPFNSSDRKFPVELNAPIDQMYVLNMEVPEGYDVDEIPKSTKVLLNENEGYFQYQIARSESMIQLRLNVKLLKSTFLPSEYNDLRDFFSFIVKKQSEQIVFKKKKA